MQVDAFIIGAACGAALAVAAIILINRKAEREIDKVIREMEDKSKDREDK